jgi:hypothetical protein
MKMPAQPFQKSKAAFTALGKRLKADNPITKTPAKPIDIPIPKGPTSPAPGTRMAIMRKGGKVKSSASKRADGCAVKGKTRGKFV